MGGSSSKPAATLLVGSPNFGVPPAATSEAARTQALAKISSLLKSREGLNALCKDLYESISDDGRGGGVSRSGLRMLTHLVIDGCQVSDPAALQELLDVLAPLPTSSGRAGEEAWLDDPPRLHFEGFVCYARCVLRVVDAALRSEVSSSTPEAGSPSEAGTGERPMRHEDLQRPLFASLPQDDGSVGAAEVGAGPSSWHPSSQEVKSRQVTEECAVDAHEDLVAAGGGSGAMRQEPLKPETPGAAEERQYEVSRWSGMGGFADSSEDVGLAQVPEPFRPWPSTTLHSSSYPSQPPARTEQHGPEPSAPTSPMKTSCSTGSLGSPPESRSNLVTPDGHGGSPASGTAVVSTSAAFLHGFAGGSSAGSSNSSRPGMPPLYRWSAANGSRALSPPRQVLQAVAPMPLAAPWQHSASAASLPVAQGADGPCSAASGTVLRQVSGQLGKAEPGPLLRPVNLALQQPAASVRASSRSMSPSRLPAGRASPAPSWVRSAPASCAAALNAQVLPLRPSSPAPQPVLPHWAGAAAGPSRPGPGPLHRAVSPASPKQVTYSIPDSRVVCTPCSSISAPPGQAIRPVPLVSARSPGRAVAPVRHASPSPQRPAQFPMVPMAAAAFSGTFAHGTAPVAFREQPAPAPASAVAPAVAPAAMRATAPAVVPTVAPAPVPTPVPTAKMSSPMPKLDAMRPAPEPISLLTQAAAALAPSASGMLCSADAAAGNASAGQADTSGLSILDTAASRFSASTLVSDLRSPPASASDGPDVLRAHLDRRKLQLESMQQRLAKLSKDCESLQGIVSSG
eukprot:TRINITY_DN25876_c0_g1_i1.p1 TRINITY_DN25876_c0_g1~~TRINITY_DN25876_c0_g1_i1.p1  ORF type:complete len:796 (+),score=138.49 TRINITY_DN25876_c0_g1_i1:171-2558(+)